MYVRPIVGVRVSADTWGMMLVREDELMRVTRFPVDAPDEYASLLSDPVREITSTWERDEVHAVAVWVGESGCLYEWPMATVDNRVSRVLRRIERYGIESPMALVVVHK